MHAALGELNQELWREVAGPPGAAHRRQHRRGDRRRPEPEQLAGGGRRRQPGRPAGAGRRTRPDPARPRHLEPGPRRRRGRAAPGPGAPRARGGRAAPTGCWRCARGRPAGPAASTPRSWGGTSELRLFRWAYERAAGEAGPARWSPCSVGAGVGKTRLVLEATGRLEGQPTLLRGRCLPYGNGQHLLAARRGGPPGRRRSGWRTRRRPPGPSWPPCSPGGRPRRRRWPSGSGS